MGYAPEIRHLPGEDLTPPDSTIIAVPYPVDCNSDAGFGRRCCDVGPVVLHRDEVKSVIRCKLACEPGREELGMEVVRNYFEFCPEKTLQVPDGFFQIFERCRVPHVTHVRGSNRKAVPVEGGICVQFRPHPELNANATLYRNGFTVTSPHVGNVRNRQRSNTWKKPSGTCSVFSGQNSK